MEAAPIIVFAYNRPALLRQALESLAANPLACESVLHLFADGPKEGASAEELKKIEEVRQIAMEKKWCGTVILHAAEKNKGLADSVIHGVTTLLKEHDRVIVIEDDALLSAHFLDYMNRALQTYLNQEKVFAIGAWTYFTERNFHGKAFLMRYPDGITWGTYRRSWEKFEPSGEKMLKQLDEKKMLKTFNGFRNLMYFEPMLKAQIAGRINSWAIRWTATAVLHGGLTVYPPVSMVRNMGFREESTHEKAYDYNENLMLATDPVQSFPEVICEDSHAFRDWRNFIQNKFLAQRSRKRKIINFIREKLPIAIHNLIFHGDV